MSGGRWETMTQKLLDRATAAGIGVGQAGNPDTVKTLQVLGKVSSGTGSLTVNVKVGNNADNLIAYPLGPITLTLGTSMASAGIEITGAWAYVAAEIPAGGITGTGAECSALLGG